MARITIRHQTLTCPHCGGTDFASKEAQLQSPALALFNLDWLGQVARVYVCRGCGRLEWFIEDFGASESSGNPSSDVAGTPWENNPGHTKR
jgi:hypothetical protein